jgi:hypothetical protein
MAIIWNTRDNGGGYIGYTNAGWSSFMNTYAFSLYPNGGFPSVGTWYYASYNVYFPNSGVYTVTAAVDNSGVLTVAGQNCNIAGFNSSTTTSFYRNRGTYTISLGMYNFPGSTAFNTNPMGMAVTIDAPPPPSPPSISFSVSPNSICNGSTATLSWSVSGVVDSVSINNGIGSVGTSGSRLVAPSSNTTYTLTASGEGGTSSQSTNLQIKQPTQTSITVDDATIIRGETTTLRWVTTGESTSATISPGIGSVNINGLANISPTETVTYQIYATGVCTNDSDTVTVTVYQPPTANLSGPESLDYGQQGTLTYEATYADSNLQIQPVYNYKTGSVNGNIVTLPTGASSSGTVNTEIPYNDNGPFSVEYTIVAMGNGGQEAKQIVIPINVDETPENFLVPESEELFKDQEPIYTPDATITSYEILVNNIDIPVEIKSNRPIQVEINDDQVWNSIRPIE